MFLHLLLGIPGALVLWHSLHQIQRGRASQSWPTVAGQIDDRYMTLSVFLPSSRRFTYTYYVGDTQFSGHRIWFGSDLAFSLPNPTRTWLGSSYLPGAQVRVAYNPNDPHDSVLKTGVSPGTYVLAAAGALMVILGAAFWMAP
jgi:Protein of unknown function (DUF3592)